MGGGEGMSAGGLRVPQAAPPPAGTVAASPPGHAKAVRDVTVLCDLPNVAAAGLDEIAELMDRARRPPSRPRPARGHAA